MKITITDKDKLIEIKKSLELKIETLEKEKNEALNDNKKYIDDAKIKCETEKKKYDLAIEKEKIDYDKKIERARQDKEKDISDYNKKGWLYKFLHVNPSENETIVEDYISRLPVEYIPYGGYASWFKDDQTAISLNFGIRINKMKNITIGIDIAIDTNSFIEIDSDDIEIIK